MSWTVPVDEGFGIEDGKTRKDEAIHVDSYKCDVYDEDGTYVSTFTVKRQGDSQEIEIPEDEYLPDLKYGNEYTIKMSETNIIGDSDPREIKVKRYPDVEITMTPDQP